MFKGACCFCNIHVYQSLPQTVKYEKCMGYICKMTPPANLCHLFNLPRRCRWSSDEHLNNYLQLKSWQTASTSWKTKPFPVFFANLWTAPVAEPRWGMWHWVQAQDFQWQLLLWLKLNLHLKTGGVRLWLLLTDVTCWNLYRVPKLHKQLICCRFAIYSY